MAQLIRAHRDGEPSSFNWIIPERLAGSSSPTTGHLKMFSYMCFDIIVCLQTGAEAYDRPRYTSLETRALGMELRNIPVQDRGPPTSEQFNEFISLMDSNPAKKVLVHCYAGQGRTGTMIAAYLGRKEGLSGEQAISRVRGIWERYIETPEQEDSLRRFLKRN
jgi:atypical dual specificity phosphatase